MLAKARLGDRDHLLAAGVSPGAQLADHKEMRSINVESSSGTCELFTRFDTGHLCSRSFAAGFRAVSV
jgi:hypothetical protein